MASLSPHNISTFLIGLFLLAGITGCHKEKIPSRDYPRVRTLEVTDVTEDGATFHGEIVKEGVLPVTDHGFVWGTTDDPLVTNGNYVSLGPFSGTGTFQTTESTGMEKGVTMYVRAYAMDAVYTVYGDLLQFTGEGNQPPVITDFLPKRVDEGDTLIIYGEHFSACPGFNEILIGTLVPEVYSASEHEIRVILPESISVSGFFPVEVNVQGISCVSSEKLYLFGPVVYGISAKSGMIGETILEITGDQFSTTPAYNHISFDSITTTALEASATRLTVLVPYNAHAGVGEVSLRVDHKETLVADTFQCLSLWEIITVQPMTRFSIPSLVIGREVYFMHANTTIWERYNLDNNSLEKLPGFYGLQCVDEAGFILQGKVYYGTGRAENTVFINDFYTYDPLSMTWQKIGSTPGNPRAGAVSFSLEGRGYLGGGNSSVGELTDFWEFDPSTESWTPKQDFPGIKIINMPFFCINGKAYVLEAKRIFEPYRHLWEYTPQTDTWDEKSQLPVTKTGTFYGFSSGPFGFIIAGNETWKYNPAEDAWRRIADIPVINHDGVTFSDEHSGYLSAYPWLCTYTTPL